MICEFVSTEVRIICALLIPIPDPKRRSKSALGRNPSVDRLNNNVRQNTIADIKAKPMNTPANNKTPVKAPSVDSLSMGSAKKTTTRISIKLHSHTIDKTSATATGEEDDCSKDSVSRYTLQTTNLPRPEYAVPVSVRTSRLELKNVKQSLNNSRREFLGLK